MNTKATADAQSSSIALHAVHSIMEVLGKGAQAPYIGEPVSQLEHGLQAAHLAVHGGHTELVILSALLHDIGHLIDTRAPSMDDFGTVDHETLGAAFLARMGCSNDLCHLVRSHVLAKRYLCWQKTEYWAGLSPASRRTLSWQGGTLGEDEAHSFETDPWFETILTLRHYDEQAKVDGLAVPGLDHYRPILLKHIEQNRCVEAGA